MRETNFRKVKKDVLKRKTKWSKCPRGGGGPKICVIVPVYCVEQYIQRCIDSILAQTFSDFELILVDDGSPDRCGAICDEYAARDSRIRVVHQDNQGQASARNHAVAIARSEWICFVDSDDVIHPQMLEHLYRAATEHHANISMCGAVEAEQLPVDFTRRQEYASSPLAMNEEGLESVYHSGEHRYWVVWGKLIRREILLKFPFVPGRVYEDNAVVFRWLHDAGSVSNIPNRYYFYQVNPAGTTKKGFSVKQLDFLWALQQQIAFYKAVGYHRMEHNAVAYYLKAGSWYLPKVCDILQDRSRANALRGQMRELMRQHPLEQLPLTDQERALIRKVTPSLGQRIIRKIKNHLK